MNGIRIVGALLVAAGGGLLVWGYQLYGSLDNKFARALGSGTSTEALITLGAGVACLVIGVALLVRK